MKVGLVAAQSGYNDRMEAELRARLAGAELLPWKKGNPALPKEVEVLLAMGSIGREQMDAMPGVALIQTLSDGYETVEMEAATELGIWVSNGPADFTGNGDSVAEFAVLLLLSTARKLKSALASTIDRSVDKPADTASLLGKTVCIVGLGSIGAKVAQRLTGFGVRLTGVDRNPLMAPKEIPTRPLEQMDEALAEADFVVLCIRASDDNKHLFDAKRLAAMKPGAVLVNIARGSLIDEAALFGAVKSGHLGGAGLDVLEEEPVNPSNPLLTLPTVFVTPHQAGLTDLTVEGTVEYVGYVLKEFAAGRKVKSILNHPKQPRRALKDE